MPVGSKGTDGTLQDGLTAAGAGAGVALHKAFATHWFTILNVESGILYLVIAMAAQKVLRMPGLAKSSDDALGDRLIALVANVILLVRHTSFLFFSFLCVSYSSVYRRLVLFFSLFHSLIKIHAHGEGHSAFTQKMNPKQVMWTDMSVRIRIYWFVFLFKFWFLKIYICYI